MDKKKGEIMMKEIVTLMLIFLVLAGMASGAEQAGNNSTGCVGCNSNSTNVTGTDTSRITYTFLQEGTGGSFVKDNSGGNYTLTINDVVPYTIYFSDRPARMAGFAPMDKFLNGFCFNKSNPPNAAVWLKEGKKDNNMVIVELTSPNYDKANKTLTYTAKILDNYEFKSNWTKDLIQTETADVAVPEKFGRVGLVIDDCPNQDVTCWSGSGWNSKNCGSIRTGCCWTWANFDCIWCHSDPDYTSECESKFSSACSTWTGGCQPSSPHKGGETPTTKPPVKEEKVPVVPVKEKTNEVKYPYTTS